ncbi:Dynamin superfamily [Vigna unguiculata]|uniref:Dynamin superfamily n=1 Tax=Vigna unguiculata TaxID=3917 RepID=A0A4D6LDI7_VIGUN|nr:Dynamin superfamily [Vigna unguiculata]
MQSAEFGDRWEVDRYLSASGYLGDSTHPFFVALPEDRGNVSNDEFRKQISQVDSEVLRHLREGVKGGHLRCFPSQEICNDERGIGVWPGVIASVNPPNATLRLYGGAAFERVMHEFRCAAYSIECPSVSREKVAIILLAHAGRGGGRARTEAAAEIARAAAKSWLSPLLDTACDQLAFVLGSLFDLALERNCIQDLECK